MKIDEECINHNVALLVGELVEELYEFTAADEGSDHMRIAVPGTLPVTAWRMHSQFEEGI